MIRWFRWRVYWLLRWFGVNAWNLRPRPRVCPKLALALLPGQFASSPSSELYIRPDKDHPAREWKWGWNKVEKLADKGRTRPINHQEMRMYKDRMAYYQRKYGGI